MGEEQSLAGEARGFLAVGLVERGGDVGQVDGGVGAEGVDGAQRGQQQAQHGDAVVLARAEVAGVVAHGGVEGGGVQALALEGVERVVEDPRAVGGVE